MDTRAVEIIVVLSGLSRDPIRSGAVSRAPNPGAGAESSAVTGDVSGRAAPDTGSVR